jgi:hypothetical protein
MSSEAGKGEDLFASRLSYLCIPFFYTYHITAIPSINNLRGAFSPVVRRSRPAPTGGSFRAVWSSSRNSFVEMARFETLDRVSGGGNLTVPYYHSTRLLSSASR